MQNKGCLIAAIIAGSFLLISFLGCIGLATLGAYQQAQEEEAIQEDLRQEEYRVRQLADGRSFRDIELKQLGNLKFSLRTSWREGVMNYNFSVSPYNYEYLAASAMSPISSWTISLEDNQGFKINEFTIERNSMIRNTAEDGSYTGMDIKGSITMDKEEYEQISDWNISWIR
ncbi:MAG: hypothetical protein KIT45_15355 [Fimbriimonadia bacterium]|nr:hypothetical protein [Fimbriimonadia bacterium]